MTVLADYLQHDRLHAGNAEDILEDAARAYLHDRLNGKDTLLMAGTDAMAAELSRRIRDNLVHWGFVDDGPSVAIINGYRASAGDRIMARKNDNWVDAGEVGRKLANRDVLRILDADPDGTGGRVQVERLTGRDDAGHEQWSAPFKLHRSYLWNHAHLAYAVTFHTAEGRTVDSGISVFTGEEDRQAVNVGMTRGRDNNEAYVIAGWKTADPKPGPEAAPELTRLERQTAERGGLDPERGAGQAGMAPAGSPQNATAEEVLANCLGNDGRELSATDIREAKFSDADRLDVLGAQWQHVSRDAARRRYEAEARAVLTDAQAAGMADDPAAEWLWRSLREAEAAGLESAGVLRRAVASGPLADAESLAKVIDWRIRQQTAGMSAVAVRAWAEQVPETGDTDMDRYARELAEAMDDRQRRLGEHAAEHPPAWARALGPVPDHPADRAGWEHKAGKVAAYREMWGYSHLHEPIGPRPGQHSPEARASWQAAAEALGRQPGDLSAHSDGQLRAWRSAFAREMAWAPPYKGADLAIVRRRSAALRSTPTVPAATLRPPIRPRSGNGWSTCPRCRPRGSKRPAAWPPTWPRCRPATTPGKPSPRRLVTVRWPPTPNSAAATPAPASNPSAPRLGPNQIPHKHMHQQRQQSSCRCAANWRRWAGSTPHTPRRQRPRPHPNRHSRPRTRRLPVSEPGRAAARIPALQGQEPAPGPRYRAQAGWPASTSNYRRSAPGSMQPRCARRGRPGRRPRRSPPYMSHPATRTPPQTPPGLTAYAPPSAKLSGTSRCPASRTPKPSRRPPKLASTARRPQTSRWRRRPCKPAISLASFRPRSPGPGR